MTSYIDDKNLVYSRNWNCRTIQTTTKTEQCSFIDLPYARLLFI